MAFLREDGYIEMSDGRILDGCEPLCGVDLAEIAACLMPGICAGGLPFGRSGSPGADGPPGPTGGAQIHYRFDKGEAVLGQAVSNNFDKNIVVQKTGIAIFGQVQMSDTSSDFELTLQVDGITLFVPLIGFTKNSKIATGAGGMPDQRPVHILAAAQVAVGSRVVRMVTTNNSAQNLTIKHRGLLVIEANMKTFLVS